MKRAALLLTFVMASLPATAVAERVVMLADTQWKPVKGLMDILRQEGHVPLDESRLLKITGPIGAITVGAVDVPRPRWWPAALEAQWKQVADACMEAGGKPPYNVSNRGSFMCGRKAAPALQQLYLDHRAPAFVIEVDSRPAGKRTILLVSRYAPEARQALVQTSEPVEQHEEELTLARLTRKLLSGEGRQEQRSVSRDLPRASASYQRAAPSLEGATIGPARWSRRCAIPLPTQLKVSPPEAIASLALTATWGKTLEAIEHLPGGAAERSCTLETSTRNTNFGGRESLMHSLQGTVDCGDGPIRATSMAVQPDSAGAALGLARRLVVAALTRWCPANETASKEHWIQATGSAKIVRGKVAAAKRQAKARALEAAVKKSGLASGEVKAHTIQGSKCTRKRCSVTVRAKIAKASSAVAPTTPPASRKVSAKGPVVRLHVTGIVGPTHLDAFQRRLRTKILGIYGMEAGPLENDQAVLEMWGSLTLTELQSAIQQQARGIFEGEVKNRADGHLSLSIQH